MSFITDNGSPFTFVSTQSSSSPEYSVGNAVVVRYTVTDLKTARIDSAGDFDNVVVVGSIGAFCLAMGVFWMFLLRLTRRVDHPATPGASAMEDPALTARPTDSNDGNAESQTSREHHQPPTTPRHDDQTSEPPGDFR